ncbi:MULTISPECIES: TcdA/TcdB pore-forming domain-containing protein [unclassified Pseudomonas]|uniref:TcdA/TcdB pore-forming domain-containing protein n=1 Tax=unclassified Pseudomonas TaxID=196821 RepID=UPI00200CAEA9|nr:MULTISPECIES: TcdA/TcdB pore-forming domain-containing protein [unclassified Pseudomonas]
MNQPNDLSRTDRPSAPIKISDLNIHPEPPLQPSGQKPGLADLDTLFGPLRIGEFSVSRQTLQALGGRIDGGPLSAANTYFSEPDQAFIDALEFDTAQIEQRMRSVPSPENAQIPPLLYEIVTQRSPDAPPLMREKSTGEFAEAMNKINHLLNATQRLDIRRNPMPVHLPDWVDKTKSRTMTSMGVGMQAYGLYSAYIGAIDALKKGDTAEALINVGGGLSEITSLGVEYALSKSGEHMIRQGSMAFEQFGKTSMGKWLCRGAGLIASVLTLPFDIYTAIKSFNDAAKAQGKEAQDLYVTGGLSVFSGALSLALGCAALAGFQAAGPVGIAAAAIMIVGAKIYGAVRAVDDIDDYIELTVNERWRAGWFAFTGQDHDKALMDRYLIAKTTADYAKALKTRSLAWLDNEFKESVDVIVNGRFEVRLQPTRLYYYEWNKGESPYKTENLPVIVDTNDVYDARDGLPTSDSILSKARSDSTKGVFWNLGGGQDAVQGVQNKANFFSYGTGRKVLHGGDKGDSFIFQSASEALSYDPIKASELSGGDGIDLLWLQGTHRHLDHLPDPPRHLGYDIDLKNGKLSLRPVDPKLEPVLHSTLRSIEKVETLAGAANRVTGSDQADIIAANGKDRVDAGAGDDQISVRGLHVTVNGGPGSDTYQLDPMSHHVSISEDGQEPSKVYLGVPLEAIQRWYIRNDALVIESLRDDDVRSPRRELTLEAVYRTIDDKRSLHNDKWTFITQDGYHLQPQWPAEITHLNDLSVSVSILTAGLAKASPVPVNDRPYKLSEKAHSDYFISRDIYHTILTARQDGTPARSTLYIDRDSTEINEVRAIYSVTGTESGAFTFLHYSNVHFTLTFKEGGGLLSLHGVVREHPGKKSDMGAGIMASGWQMIHPLTLIMRDGVSYQLDAPRNSYLEDAKRNGYTLVQSPASLRERAGKYIFVRPFIEKRTLKATPQRVDFQDAEHHATYWLEGRSSTYELLPASHLSIRLSTAEADTHISGSSTWHIHTQHLQEQITSRDLAIKDNLLKIGSIRIHLPESNDPALPLETVEVVVTSGNRYRINALFEVIGLYAVDARAYSSVQAIIQDIAEHQQRDELETRHVQVRHIRLRDGAPGRIFYNTDTRTWSSESTPSRSIPIEQLLIVKE